MPSRNLLQYATVLFKGLAMGAADVVPGVSGGTIAFISGIYEELIETIHRLDFGFFKHWKRESFSSAWKEYNIGFLIALFGGILISVLSLSKVISYLLEVHPILVWSFFFGLVIASILFVGKQITTWNGKVIIATILAIAFSYFITIAEPLGTPDSMWFLLFAGFIAIIAMILPGISGAFILLLLGAYTGVIGILNGLRDGVTNLDWELFSGAFIKLVVFALGAIVGLKVFSGALNWLFKNHKNLILAILTGFMIGALNKIWPWKEVLSTRINSHGEEVTFLDRSILPSSFDGAPQVLFAIGMAITGFLVIFLMERFANSKKNRAEKS